MNNFQVNQKEVCFHSFFFVVENKFSFLKFKVSSITKYFKKALNNYKNDIVERNLLFIIFTDGSPNSDKLSSTDAIIEFKEALEDRNPIDKIFVTIVACTDDEFALNYLNNWDNTIPNLDVVDDYESERKEINSAGKVDTSFTYGDYIAKILLGSFVKEIDELDE
jgi:hypothetical protein